MKPVNKVIISGASSGLGLALAQFYLQQGACVALWARRLEPLQQLAQQFPTQAYAYQVDVRQISSIQAAADDYLQRFGAPDLVIANAGVSVGTLTEYAEDIHAFEQVMDINVLGMVRTFQPFINVMRAAKQGALVGIASVAGVRGLPGASAYSASKSAAITYLESLRVELRNSGVQVSTICPGYIKTPMTAVNPYPMPFILEANEAARRIARAIQQGKSKTVVPWQMGLVAAVLKWLPNWLYDRLFANAPHKPRNLL